MGSTLGGSTRCHDWAKGKQARLQAFPQRAAPYTLDFTQPFYSLASHAARQESATHTVLVLAVAPWEPNSRLYCEGPSRAPRRSTAAPISLSLADALLSPRQSIRRRSQVLPLPAANPITNPSTSPTSSDYEEVPYTCDGGLAVKIRQICTLDELRQVATLRADAYYADNQSRFVGSLKKKFVEQEVESLQQRTTILSRNGHPFMECLVAVDVKSCAVLGCIDMRLPAALNGTHPHGVPEDDPNGCYLLNVVVREDVRGQGLGRGIMRIAMGRAVRLWEAGALYTHVEADNEVAYGLYRSCGFLQHSVDAKYGSASKLGQMVLLQAPAAATGATTAPAA